MDLHLLTNRISHPVVCSLCADEFESGGSDAGSLQEYARLDAGFTDQGIQVWCRRHERNVVHVDFAGQMLEADFRCLEPAS